MNAQAAWFSNLPTGDTLQKDSKFAITKILPYFTNATE